ncbi:heterokaryon incompatibility protein-domain-containing protein [Exophiala viscosa]|uniref:heterokaryon incompatibility protein-domain-containing protein n=1 Tax=Exophiala viscosa TaxID=2486360 RepID=UPI00219AEF0B|nr:heterokaryon incompatibility protein-domain-containing protein [Exophiala viscosa]
MRLLHINSDGKLSLTRDWKDWTTDFPRYAILSHTWGPDEHEVTFTDLRDGSGNSKAGYLKIQFCGEQARRDGLQYFWVDTCCIDKSSSAELQEAINSMFRWYQNAARCYVYLSDVSTPVPTGGHQDTSDPIRSALWKSRWFRRGWTLQELIAPVIVEFFSLEGNNIGSKRSLEQDIHHVTGIALEVLRGAPLTEIAVEERLSWADQRETSHPEDEAYCLLGLFKIFMSLLYGEGRENAFVRLREEIAKSSNRASQHATCSPFSRLSQETSPVTRGSLEAAGTSCDLDHDSNNAGCRSNASSSGESSRTRKTVLSSEAPKPYSCAQKGVKRRTSDISTSTAVRGPKRTRYVEVDVGTAHQSHITAQTSVPSQTMAPGAFESLCGYVRSACANYLASYNADPSQPDLAQRSPVRTSISNHHVWNALSLIVGAKAVYQDPYVTKVIHALFDRPSQVSIPLSLMLFASALAGHLLPRLQLSSMTDDSLCLEDALGETIRVPQVICQYYETFHDYLVARFKDHLGLELVIEKNYRLIIGGMEGPVLDTTKWSQVIKVHPRIKLTMAMVLSNHCRYVECTVCRQRLRRRSYQLFVW